MELCSLPAIYLGPNYCGGNGMITDLDPDILEWEVKWALGSITMNKASGYDGIPADLFQVVNTAPPINRKLD